MKLETWTISLHSSQTSVKKRHSNFEVDQDKGANHIFDFIFCFFSMARYTDRDRHKIDGEA